MVEEPVSKSQRKRDMHSLQAMGERLVNLSKARLAKMPISERLRDAIIEMKRLTSHEAKRRQMQFIGRLMRNEQVELIEEALTAIESIGLQASKDLHDIEDWRTQLLERKEALTEFICQFPTTDIQHLRHLIRDAVQEKKSGKPPGAGRTLFRYLRGICHST